MKILFVLLLIILSFNTFSQNLVPNPGFEEMKPHIKDDFRHCKNWNEFNESLGDPPLISDASEDLNRRVRTGKYAVGLTLRRTTFCSNYRNFAGTYLTEPLVAGEKYYVEFWVWARRNDCQFVNSIGLHFANGPIDAGGVVSTAVNLTAQIQSPDNQTIDNVDCWRRIAGIYIAEGGEDFIAIGNFKTDAETIVTDSYLEKTGGVLCGQTDYIGWIHLNVDDVLVTKDFTLETEQSIDSLICIESGPYEKESKKNYIECEVSIPNILTVNDDGVNDELPLDFGGEWTFTVLDRWGNTVYDTDFEKELFWNGKEDNDKDLVNGTYFFILNDFTKKCQKYGPITIIDH